MLPGDSSWFNARQVFIVCWTLLSFAVLLFAVQNGLLGHHPEMPARQATGRDPQAR